MADPEIVSREEWLAARRRLLAQEKEATRARDRLNAERRRLPMVRVDKPYEFEGPRGKAVLADLFEGRRQLIVYHFMFHPDWAAGCRFCSGFADEIARGHLQHLRARDTALALVSRAPQAKLAAFRARMGWTVPWYSSHGSEFNFDFGVTLDERIAPLVYDYQTRAEHEQAGTGFFVAGEPPVEAAGISCFLRDGSQVFHTYSTYARGAETVGGSHYFLDLTALGRQEPWEEPADRAPAADAAAGGPPPYPDEYTEV